MAWSWSHTQEAYDNARKQLDIQTPQFLIVCWAEWKTHEREQQEEEFDFTQWQEAYANFVLAAESLWKQNPDAVINDVWDKMEEKSTCTNGGERAWCCPDGCHTVPFEEPSDDDLAYWMDSQEVRV